MSYLLLVRPDAENDMAEALDWYDRQRAGLGDELLTAIEEVFVRIRKSPELFAAEYKSIRRARVTRFPYIVYYRFASGTVEVIAVLHGSRSPRSWRSRS